MLNNTEEKLITIHFSTLKILYFFCTNKKFIELRIIYFISIEQQRYSSAMSWCNELNDVSSLLK